MGRIRYHRESTSNSVRAASPIEELLDNFETAWMGTPKTQKSALSSLLHDAGSTGTSSPDRSAQRNPPSGTSPSSSGLMHGQNGATSMPMTSKRPHEADSDELTMLPMTPFPSHMLLKGALGGGGGDAAPSLTASAAVGAAGPAAVPVPTPASALGMKAAPGGQQFAPVFFSPIPLSYLSVARSESESSFLDSVVGSPDVTLRGGRLAKTTSGDWSSDVAQVSWQVNFRSGPDSDKNCQFRPFAISPFFSHAGLGLLRLIRSSHSSPIPLPHSILLPHSRQGLAARPQEALSQALSRQDLGSQAVRHPPPLPTGRRATLSLRSMSMRRGGAAVAGSPPLRALGASGMGRNSGDLLSSRMVVGHPRGDPPHLLLYTLFSPVRQRPPAHRLPSRPPLLPHRLLLPCPLLRGPSPACPFPWK